jgi:hypothetical protein
MDLSEFVKETLRGVIKGVANSQADAEIGKYVGPTFRFEMVIKRTTAVCSFTEAATTRLSNSMLLSLVRRPLEQRAASRSWSSDPPA